MYMPWVKNLNLVTLTPLKYFCINHGAQRFFCQFEIIINVLVSSFRFIWIPILWVYDHLEIFWIFQILKGNKTLPENDRDITILEAALESFLRAGFRKGYTTNDHIFNMKCLIDVYLSKKKTTFCAFLDFRKAFDTEWRCGLYSKLVSSGISGKLLNVIIKREVFIAILSHVFL